MKKPYFRLLSGLCLSFRAQIREKSSKGTPTHQTPRPANVIMATSMWSRLQQMSSGSGFKRWNVTVMPASLSSRIETHQISFRKLDSKVGHLTLLSFPSSLGSSARNRRRKPERSWFDIQDLSASEQHGQQHHPKNGDTLNEQLAGPRQGWEQTKVQGFLSPSLRAKEMYIHVWMIYPHAN